MSKKMGDKELLSIENTKNQAQIERLVSANEVLRKIAAKKQQCVDRLYDAIESTIDRMLRQTIAMKTHSERNQDMRRWSSELLQILRIADDDDNVPYDPPF